MNTEKRTDIDIEKRTDVKEHKSMYAETAQNSTVQTHCPQHPTHGFDQCGTHSKLNYCDRYSGTLCKMNEFRFLSTIINFAVHGTQQ